MDENATTSVSEPTLAGSWLDPGACWERLRGVELGRLAVVVDGRPEIFPVNHIVDHGTIVFRTSEGLKLTAAAPHGFVAFEADGVDTATGAAWSVVVKGVADEIRDLEDLVDTATLPLAPWHGAPKHRFVRIVPEQITGRQFAVVDPAVWRNPFTLRRSAPME